MEVFFVNTWKALFQKGVVFLKILILPCLFWFEKGLGRKRKVTEAYPDPVSSRFPEDLPRRFRGFLWNDIRRCTACEACQKICPTQCIYLEPENKKNEQKKASFFEIDTARCLFCGLCVRVCVPRSLKHTREFEGAAFYRIFLKHHFGVRKTIVQKTFSEKDF